MFMRALAFDEEYLPLRMTRNRDWHALWQLREHIVIRARDAARKRGRSYRDFQVGATAFLSSTKPKLLRSIGRASNAIYTGSNWKLGKEERNTCAEQEIVAQIRQQQHLFPARKVLALVIAGEPQNEPDAKSGLLTPTLHPCQHCRRLLAEVPEMKDDTVIITVSLTTDAMEIMSFRELIGLHATTIRDLSSVAA
jgi:cytidine deaminase